VTPITERIERIRSSMTPGQRWTAGLALALATAVLRFGLPADQVVVPAAAAGTVPTRAAGAFAGPTAAAPTLDAGPAPALDVVPVPVGPDASKFVANFPSALVLAPPRVVALVRSGGTAPGRDDASVASVFLTNAGFSVTTIIDDPADTTVCARTLAAGRFVLASLGLETPLRDCLIGGGANVLTFDDLGPLDGAFSTRRGIGAALGDLARRAPTGALAGRVGIVAGARVRPLVDAAVDDMTGAGVNVVDVVTLADDVSNADVADAVRRFMSENVEVVVFAAPVARQRQWLGPAGVLLPAARYVVADAYDAVATDETYPPSFDGALAVTSLRGPWFQRAHAETARQQVCRTRWEAKATPPAILPGAETVDVYAWCEHVALAEQVLQRAVLTGSGVEAALADARLDDPPLTSELAEVDGGGLGPIADAVVVWRASCACWVEQSAFAPR
jgi:hypothetical protein